MSENNEDSIIVKTKDKVYVGAKSTVGNHATGKMNSSKNVCTTPRERVKITSQMQLLSDIQQQNIDEMIRGLPDINYPCITVPQNTIDEFLDQWSKIVTWHYEKYDDPDLRNPFIGPCMTYNIPICMDQETVRLLKIVLLKRSLDKQPVIWLNSDQIEDIIEVFACKMIALMIERGYKPPANFPQSIINHQLRDSIVIEVFHRQIPDTDSNIIIKLSNS